MQFADFDQEDQKGTGVSWPLVLAIVLFGSVMSCAALLIFLNSGFAARHGFNPLTKQADGAVVADENPVAEKGDSSITTASITTDADEGLRPLRDALANPAASVQRMNALFAFNVIVAGYGKTKGIYPNSHGQFVPVIKALEVIGNADYQRNVPASVIGQMQYVSNGQSYKVIIAGAGDCAVVRALKPDLVDPKRSSGALDCMAYGYWSPLGINF